LGGWYAFSDCTKIRAYRFEGTPYLLPKIVPNRVAYLEIMRQLAKLETQNISVRKRNFTSHPMLSLMEKQVRNSIHTKIFYPTRSQIEDWWSLMNVNKAYNKA
jgi:hypothetical protein